MAALLMPSSISYVETLFSLTSTPTAPTKAMSDLRREMKSSVMPPQKPSRLLLILPPAKTTRIFGLRARTTRISIMFVTTVTSSSILTRSSAMARLLVEMSRKTMSFSWMSLTAACAMRCFASTSVLRCLLTSTMWLFSRMRTAPPYVRLSLPFFSSAPRSLRMQSSVTLNFSLRSRTRTLPSRASMLRMMS